MATPKQQKRSPEPSTPLSPMVTSRRDEKDQMVNLNNRLAVYVEKVRSLETENSRLHIQISSYEESSTSELSHLKGMYESELAEARRLLDELSKEKAQLQIEAASCRDKAESEKNRSNTLEHDNAVLEKKLKEANSRLSHKEGQLSAALREKDGFKDELDSLRGKLNDLQEELEAAQRTLEAETLQRVDFENKLQSAREELLFKERLYREQITEVRKRHDVSLTEVDARVKGDYECKFEDAMMELRDQQSADLEQMREELEFQYSGKVTELTKKLDLAYKAQLKTGDSRKGYELKIEKLQATIHVLQSKNNSLSNKLHDLEGQIETERELRLSAVLSIEKQRDEARAKLLAMEKEYADLLDLKLKLDQEIGVYRKLLEEEEQRLNLSPSPMNAESGSKTRARTRRKRKRVVAQVLEVESKSRKQEKSEVVHCETAQGTDEVGKEDILHEQVDAAPDSQNTCSIM